LVKVIKLEISTMAHATEDVEKVKKAILNIIDPELHKHIKIKITTAKGYYGNPITLFKVVLRGNKASKEFSYIISRLNTTEKKLLSLSLENRIDDFNNLYIRISKQDAYLGTIKIFDGDDVIKVTASLSKDVTINDIRRILEEK